MKANVGGIDRILRIAVGLLGLAYFFFGPAETKVWGLIGLVPLGTAVIGFCPAYPLLGISTCKMKSKA